MAFSMNHVYEWYDRILQFIASLQTIDCLVTICVTPTGVLGSFAFAALVFGMLRWQLSCPYVGVGSAFYEQQRRFVLTGCASGMGRHLTGVLLRARHRVYATDLDLKALHKTAKEDSWDALPGEVVIQELDVTNRMSWKLLLQAVEYNWGGCDVLMNIAGLLMPKKIQDASASDIDLHIDVMVKGPIHGTQLAAAMMMKHEIKGHIINVSSMAAVAPVSGVTLYGTAKFGCRGFSLAAAKDLAPCGVAVTCLMPDAVQTPMVDLQLNYDGGAYAYSGKILTVHDVEKSLMTHILPNRPVEVWLSPRRSVVSFFGIGGMLAGVIHSSRLVLREERQMMKSGLARQEEIKKRDTKSDKSD